MSKIDEQIAREKASVTRGKEIFYEKLRRAADKGVEFDGQVGQRFVYQLMHRMIRPLVERQKQVRRQWTAAQQTGRRLSGWEEMFLLLDPEDIAYLTVYLTLARGDKIQRSVQMFGRHLGLYLNKQFRFRQLEARERARVKGGGQPSYNRLNKLKAEVKVINARHARKWEKRLSDLALDDWPIEARTHLGVEMAQMLVDVCPDGFEMELVRRNGRVHKTLRRTEALEKALDQAYQTFSEELPWMIPMVCPPRPWGLLSLGGYLEDRQPLIKDTHKLRSRSAPGDETVAGLNRIQDVAWAINRDVYRVALEARARNLTQVLPVGEAPALPERVSDDVYKAMTREEKQALSLKRRAIHDERHQLEGHREAMRRQLEVARVCMHEPALYFPHNLDFRGRVYPIPQDLNPQADDFGKALLQFSERKQLGQTGFEWLCYHVANCYGMDKGSRADQLVWVADHDAMIRAVATHPFDHVNEWAPADEPWQFLAAAMEYTRCQEGGADPAEYWSALPIHIDGSCNGLQHLAAMARDPQAALAVNLTSALDRQDIYQNVADRVAASVAEDAARSRGASAVSLAHLAPAERWHGKVTRKTVKRAVMTTPYGLTAIGMRDQLIDDGFCRGLPGDPQENAGYLRDKIMEAMGDELGLAMDTMRWLQDNATILATNDLGVSWTAPGGFKVHMEYIKHVTYRYTVNGKYRVAPGATNVEYQFRRADLETGLLAVRQKLAIVPNIIHSFDAAHLIKTVLAAPADLDVAVVHDSFGTHACDVPRLAQVIREQFVEIYRQDWFTSLMHDFNLSRLGGDFPLLEPPARGSFNIEETLDAEYFFA